MHRIAYWVALGVSLISTTAAFSASFDCTKAQSKIDTAICRSPRVSELDETLDHIYKNLLANVAADERQRLIEEQRKWLRMSRNACGDESCLIDAYKSRIEELKLQAASAPIEPLSKIEIAEKTFAPIGKGYPTIIRQLDGILLYQHYDDTGNTKDIVELDFVTGKSRVLIPGRRDPGLIAVSPQYFVLTVAGHPPSFPTEVIDRTSGQTVKKLRLGEPTFGSFTDGKQLHLLQGQSGYGEESALKITRLELPSMKVLGTSSIFGSRLISTDYGLLVVLGYRSGRPQLIFYDYLLKERGRVEIPPPQEKRNLSCQPGNFRREGDIAVIVANCGEIHVINMKIFAIEKTIPRHANFYSLVLRNGLIYTTSGKQDGIVVFDTRNGRELGRIPIRGTHLFTNRDRLLVVGNYTPYEAEKWPVSVYRIDDRPLKSGSWRIQSVRRSCADAQRVLASTSDLYRAIELCNQGGIDALLLGADAIPADLTGVAIEYASWLTRTLHLYDLGLKALEKLGSIGARADDAYEATVKKATFSPPAGVVSGAVQSRGEFSKALARGLQRKPRMQFKLHDRLNASQIYFYDDYVYEPRWSCYNENDGVYVDIYERKTFKLTHALKVLPCDNEQEDNVFTIAADQSRLYVRTTFKYDDSTRKDYFVFAKSGWRQVAAKVFTPGADAFPLVKGINDRDIEEGEKTKETKSFVVKRDYKPPKFIYHFHKKGAVDNAKPVASFTVSSKSASYPDLVVIPGSDRIVLLGETDDNSRRPLVYFDPVRGISRTFAMLPKLGAWAIDESGFYVSNGSDILVFDLNTFSLREVWPRTLRDNWQENDSSISGLYVHRKDLIVRTDGGTTYLFPTTEGR